LLKNPIIYFINQEISAERERSIAIVSAAINRQDYGPCQYGTPSLNSSPERRQQNPWSHKFKLHERIMTHEELFCYTHCHWELFRFEFTSIHFDSFGKIKQKIIRQIILKVDGNEK
jgi:hypothetical protein